MGIVRIEIKQRVAIAYLTNIPLSKFFVFGFKTKPPLRSKNLPCVSPFYSSKKQKSNK